MIVVLATAVFVLVVAAKARFLMVTGMMLGMVRWLGGGLCCSSLLTELKSRLTIVVSAAWGSPLRPSSVLCVEFNLMVSSAKWVLFCSTEGDTNVFKLADKCWVGGLVSFKVELRELEVKFKLSELELGL